MPNAGADADGECVLSVFGDGDEVVKSRRDTNRCRALSQTKELPGDESGFATLDNGN
jgi:hypothetical protein